MRYTLIISTPPRSSANARACRFAKTLLACEHRIECVFFFDAGASCALASAVSAQDEDNILAQWAALAPNTTLTVCSASAAKYGVLSADEAARLQQVATAHPAFEVGGLGQLQAAIGISDRVVSFNG